MEKFQVVVTLVVEAERGAHEAYVRRLIETVLSQAYRGVLVKDIHVETPVSPDEAEVIAKLQKELKRQQIAKEDYESKLWRWKNMFGGKP